MFEQMEAMYAVGCVPTGITTLQRLQHLRLDNCVRAPLPGGISQMTQLTSLHILQGDFGFNHQIFSKADGLVVCCGPILPSLHISWVCDLSDLTILAILMSPASIAMPGTCMKQ